MTAQGREVEEELSVMPSLKMDLIFSTNIKKKYIIIVIEKKIHYKYIPGTVGTPPPGRIGSKDICPAVSAHSATAKKTENSATMEDIQSNSKVFVQQRHNFQRRQSKFRSSGKRHNISFGPLGKSSLSVLRKRALVRANHAFTEQFPKRISISTCTFEAQKGDFATSLVTAQ